MTHPIAPIALFMQLGGQKVPADVDYNITPGHIEKFIERIDEEVEETYVAADIDSIYWEHPPGINHAEVLDGFIDTAYVALTGAIRVVGEEKARKAWDAVVEANLSKVDGRFGPPVIDYETGKIGKPEGWIAPDIEAIINL